ncbi:hypothetical protein ACIQUG_08095 [Ensifer sp. NPDC090286]|uniref:hypothetical protein n=1 Tax=Ensifer sp. NPDC090286 TaxID=3363991 RepID=UPI00383B3D5C
MSAAQQRTETEDVEPIDELAAALAWHLGDKDATIRTLLDDCKHLRQQLAFARGTMSVGFARGWRPSLDRSVDGQR